MTENMPVFVKIENYRDMTSLLAATREKLRQAKALFERIKEVKNKEDEYLASWARELEDVESRVSAVDSAMTRQA